MAEIQLSSSGANRRKLTTPRVDLTPMVDLGFLLVTFFMYTTTLAQPKVLELQMPYVSPDASRPTPIPGEATLILLPAAGHRVAYFNGLKNPVKSLAWCGFEGSNDLRSLLEREQLRVKTLPPSFSKEAHKLHVLIKPDTSAAYEDIVRVLDEMAIADVPYYTIMRITSEEQAILKKSVLATYGN